MTPHHKNPLSPRIVFAPAFLFDLDGTLIHSVYQHVLAWREALESAGIELAAAVPSCITNRLRVTENHVHHSLYDTHIES